MQNAICITCGHVGSWDEYASFEKATDYEYTTTGGAEKDYKKIVNKLTTHLMNIDVVELKQLERNKKLTMLHTSTTLYIGFPTTAMNRNKSVLIFLLEQQRA